MNVIYSGQFAGFISIINQTIKIKTTSTFITSYIRIVQCSILYKNILMIIFSFLYIELFVLGDEASMR